MLQEVLSKKYNLDALVDPFVYSKMKNQNTNEFASIIDRINTSQDICVKVASIDFLDSKNRRVLDYYKDIDYQSFDKIIFVTRDDLLAASLSFCHMTTGDPSTWHSTKEQQNTGKTFSADINRVTYLLRSYRVFEFVKNHIRNNFTNDIYEYEYESLESNLKIDLELSAGDFDTNLVANTIDYQKVNQNYSTVVNFIEQYKGLILSAQDFDLNRVDSKFWTLRFDS